MLKSEPIKIISLGDLGPGNEGSFGPGSEEEFEALKDIDKPRYWGPRLDDSACMDDRLEGLRLHLAGNRAVAEAAAEYLDKATILTSFDRTLGRKTAELVAFGRIPIFHKKCAALASVKPALEYGGEHEDDIVDALWPKLGALNIGYITEQELRGSIKTGVDNARQRQFWGATPEQLLEIADQNGAEIEDAPGEHQAAGNLDNMSQLGFNNGLFRREHSTDDGQPLGLLTIDWAGYYKQLFEDVISEIQAAKRLMRVGIFVVAIQKLINKDGSPLVTVGQ